MKHWILIIVCATLLALIVWRYPAWEDNLVQRRIDNCHKTKMLFPDAVVIYTHACYIEVGKGVFIKSESHDPSLYTMQEILEGAN